MHFCEVYLIQPNILVKEFSAPNHFLAVLKYGTFGKSVMITAV